MQIVTPEQIEEWLRIDPNTDVLTLNMLVAGAIDVVEHYTNLRLRPYTDALTGETVEPLVPEALKHAIAVLVHAHYDNRTGAEDSAMKAVERLCRPYRVVGL